MLNDRTPEQIDNALDRTEQILSDLTIRLDRLESNVGRLETTTEAIAARVQDLFDVSDRTNAAIDRLVDQQTSTNAAIDRLSGIVVRYIDQSSMEGNYQRQRVTELTTRVATLESND